MNIIYAYLPPLYVRLNELIQMILECNRTGVDALLLKWNETQLQIRFHLSGKTQDNATSA